MAAPATFVPDAPAPASPAAPDLDALKRAAALKHGLDAGVFFRQLHTENPAGDPNAVSPKGAIGIAQLMPETAKELGVDPRDPAASIDAAARLMRQHLDRYKGDYRLALAAYNAGQGNVEKAGGVPNFPETRGYIRSALQAPATFQPDAASATTSAPKTFVPEAAPAPAAAKVPADTGAVRLPGVVAAQQQDQRHQLAVMRAFPEALPQGQEGPPAPGQPSFETASERLAHYESLSPAAKAALRVSRGIVGTLPGTEAQGRERRAFIPEPANTAERLQEGAGGALTFGAEAAGLSLIPGIGPMAAAALPAIAQPGTTEQRTARGLTMAAASLAGPAAAPLGKAAEHAAGVAAFGGVAPWVETAAHRLLGQKDAPWPTAREMVENVGLLAGLSAGAHFAGRAVARAEPKLDPAKVRGFRAIERHLADPGFHPDVPASEHARLRSESARASAELNRQLAGARVTFQSGGSTVSGDFAYGRIYPYPGEVAQVRLVIHDPASGAMVPFAFRDLSALRDAVAASPEPGVETRTLAPEPARAEGQPPSEPVAESRLPGAGPARARAAGGGIPVARPVSFIPSEPEAASLPTAPIPKRAPGVAPHPIVEAAGKVREALREVVAFANPVRFAVGKGLDALMKAKGGLKRALFRTERAQKALHSFWERRSKEEVLNFWNRLESGNQPDPRLAEIDAAYRERSDNIHKAISEYKSVAYWENWFPHLWKHPDRARAVFQGRRPMEGSKSFLKGRTLEDIESGLKAGLEPVSWNPEELMQLAEHNARKFVMVQELVKKLKAIGSLKFVRLGKKPPEDFRRLDQNWAKVYLNPEIELQEYHDARVMGGLQSVADELGIKRERAVRIGGKGRLGYSQAGSTGPGGILGAIGRAGPGKVTTKFATPESVLAHEIGHQIDNIYGLRDAFIRKSTPAEKAELRALADLRLTGQETPGHKAYVRSGPEKMAVMIEALIHAPEEFKRVAPKNYDKLVKFLSGHPDLKPLLDIKPSLLYAEGTSTVSAGGAVLGGEYWAQRDLARLLDNHMSRDLIGETALGRGVMASRNTLNAINLGLSAFHATGTTLLSVMSRFAAGLSETAHGAVRFDPALLASGLGKAATAPLAPITYVRNGWRFYHGAPELAAIEEHLFTGGASLEGKQYYKNQMFDRFVRNARQTFASGSTPFERLGHASRAAAQAPFAAVEAGMRVLTNYYIPQMKVGAFRDLFSSQLRIKDADIASGKETTENVARVAWRDVEDRFGLINYDNEFWNQTLKAAVMVLIRAPGWTLGTLRALGSAAFVDLPRFAARGATGKAPEWTSRMSFALSMVTTTMAVGGIYHYLHTGKKPQTLEDYLHPMNGLKDGNGKPQRVDFPTFMKDVQAWTTDPVKAAVGRIRHGGGASSLFHGGKLAPEITATMDLLENQSYRGPIHRPLRTMKDWYPATTDVMRYLFEREQPFSIQQAKEMSKRSATREEMTEAFFGITPHHEAKKAAERSRRPFKSRYY